MPSNPVNITNGFTENPIVYQLPNGIYFNIFDYIDMQDTGFGFGYSQDGITWTSGDGVVVTVPNGGVRTPVALILEETGLYSFFYTRTTDGYECLYTGNVNITITN